jgi:sugar lactone lactonase YvrE
MPVMGSPSTPRRLAARSVTTAAAEHGEGPVWDERRGVLHWVDMLRGDILTLDPRAVTDDQLVVPDRVHVSDVVAVLRPRRGGGWVLATERGFALTEADDWDPRSIGNAFESTDIRMNEGGCDAAGGLVCGSMAYDKRRGAATVYRLDPDGTIEVLFGDVTISNGFSLDPAATMAYYIDTPTDRIDRFDLGADGKTLSDRRPFVTIEPGVGHPDGLTVDTEGGVWVALYGGSAVRRYAADGTLDVIVDVPTPHVTACTFGGPDLGDLYITTSQEDLDLAAHPAAGTLYTVRPGWTGLLPRPYGG